MNRFTLVLALFAALSLISCSDVAETPKEKSELEKCIDANVSLIKNIDAEGINKFPELLKLPVKIDLNFLKSRYEGIYAELEEYEVIKQNINNLGNKDTAPESFKYLQDNGFLTEDLNIHLDADEVYFTVIENNKTADLQSVLNKSEENLRGAEFFEIYLAPTIKSTSDNTLSEIAQNVCWSQGIY